MSHKWLQLSANMVSLCWDNYHSPHRVHGAGDHRRVGVKRQQIKIPCSLPWKHNHRWIVVSVRLLTLYSPHTSQKKSQLFFHTKSQVGCRLICGFVNLPSTAVITVYASDEKINTVSKIALYINNMWHHWCQNLLHSLPSAPTSCAVICRRQSVVAG